MSAAEIFLSREEWDNMRAEIERLLHIIGRQQSEIERLRAALEYYASGIAGRGDIARHVLKDKPLAARPIKGNPSQDQREDD